MEIEGLFGIISLAVSGALVIYKLIRKFQKSNCVVITKEGEKYELNFDDLQKGFEKSIEVAQELSEGDKNKLRKIASDLIKKTKEEITSPKSIKNDKNDKKINKLDLV